jgi:tricorn protease
MSRSLLRVACFLLAASALAQTNRGYYRYPAVYGNTVVFTAEGDLWSVGIEAVLNGRYDHNFASGM